MKKDPILSICIPSYNRINVLEKNLKSICKCHSNEIEIIVMDNCSSVDVTYLSSIDERIRVYKQKTFQNSLENGLSSLNVARGKYRLQCLDKDIVLGEKIDDVLKWLEKSKSISVGYVNININNSKNTIEEITLDNAVKYFYNGIHPSGMIVRRDVCKATTELLRKNVDFCHATMISDFFIAQGLSMGNLLYIDNGMILTESKKAAKKTKSYSAKYQGKCFFEPEERVRQRNLDFKHLSLLPIGNVLKNKIARHIFRTCLYQSTFDYLNIMKDADICSHYNIRTKNVSYREITSIFLKQIHSYYLYVGNSLKDRIFKYILFIKWWVKLLLMITINR